MEFTPLVEKPLQESKTEKKHKTLRIATLDDIPVIMELAKEFYTGSAADVIRLDFNKIRRSLEAGMIDLDSWLFLLSYDEETDEVVGGVFAYISDSFYSDERIAVEVFLYVKESHRKGRRGVDLLKGFEYWAKLKGCKYCQYAHLRTSPERMERLYEKRGMQLLEKIYLKEL